MFPRLPLVSCLEIEFLQCSQRDWNGRGGEIRTHDLLYHICCAKIFVVLSCDCEFEAVTLQALHHELPERAVWIGFARRVILFIHEIPNHN